jgi:hypothetical protein
MLPHSNLSLPYPQDLKPSPTSVRKLPPPEIKPATPAAAERWASGFPSKFLRFQKELRLIVEARVVISCDEAEIANRIALAASRTNVPLNIALALCKRKLPPG